MAATQQMSPQQQMASATAANMAIRNLIVNGDTTGQFGFQPPAVTMTQALNPQVPANTGPGSVLTVQLRNVGLVKRLYVHVTATVTAGAQALTLTKTGLPNLVSNVLFTDLANNQRINTTGWHLQLLSSVKRRRVFGAAYTSDTPCGYGNVFNNVMSAPSTIDSTDAANISYYFEVPFSYTDHDLTGILFADVTQATMQVQITINPGALVVSGVDPTLAMYQSAGAAAGTLTNVSVQVYQQYLDQVPRDLKTGVPYYPPIDIGTAYMLNATSSGLPVVNQDNAVPFVNARKFLSTAFIYDNAGSQNIGNDVSSVAITSANLTNILRADPSMMVILTRNRLGDDVPAAMYYFDFRDRPVNTNQYGNMQIILNPSSVGGSTATQLFGWESFGIIGQVQQGGAIPSGA